MASQQVAGGIVDAIGDGATVGVSLIGEVVEAVGQARQDFSRKLKWDPSDFSGEKFSWRLLPSAARLRPA
ncbi:hypothetical protein, partial [Methylovulum psychrotolerans]|uniref:hypothetical protein n=1 Tax=Methylovulum psychrotolerans TaxID=1704499 RepID=UPI001B80C753